MASEQKEEVVAKRRSLPRLFEKELRTMMYGFGDDENPCPDTIRLMEDIILDYIANLVVKVRHYNNNNCPLHILHILYQQNATTNLLTPPKPQTLAPTLFHCDVT